MHLCFAVAALLTFNPVTAQDEVPDPQSGTPVLPASGSGVPSPGATEVKLHDEIVGRFLERHGASSAPAPCEVSREQVKLQLNAKGEITCTGPRLSELPDGAKLRIEMTVPKALADKYVMRIELGKETSSGIRIHGSWDNTQQAAQGAAELLAKIRGRVSAESGHKKLADDELEPTSLSKEFGPFFGYDTVSLKVALAESSVAASHEITVVHPSPLGLGVVGLVGPDIKTYAIENDTLLETTEKLPASFYVGVHWYFAAWENGKNGRLFLESGPTLPERLSLTVGLRAPDPTEGLYTGLSFEVAYGLVLTGGVQLRREQHLKEGFSAGQTLTGDEVPADKAWKAVPSAGLALQSDIVGKFLELFK